MWRIICKGIFCCSGVNQMNYLGKKGFLCFVAWMMCVVSIEAGPPKLKKEDVRISMDAMMKNHICYNALSPLIMKRAVKLYIEQLDPYKIYLLDSEVKKFLNLDEETLIQMVRAYRKDAFPVFQDMDAMMTFAIKRARKARALFDYNSINVGGLPYAAYAATEQELQSRCLHSLWAMISGELQGASFESLSVERQHKMVAFASRYFEKQERAFLLSASAHLHAQSMRILKVMARSLDAHTMYFSPEEAFELRASLEKQFEGVGIVVREGVDGVFIVNVIPGGPADKSQKIYPGDLILSIDGKPTLNATYEEVLDLLKGKGRSSVTLVVGRVASSGERMDERVTLVREKIVMSSERVQVTAEPFGSGVIGKIIVPAFYESQGGAGCAQDILDAIRELRGKGELLGLVMDFRGNSGGFLSQAIKVVSLFVKSGIIVVSKYAHEDVQYFRNIDGRVYYDGPLVILHSKASASAAEIVAQALQDYGIALVVGDKRSYGKGTIQYQTVTDENARAFFKVTVGRYYTVSGKSTQIEGVLADVVVPTVYAPYRIGEKYLEYPLPGDHMPPLYVDPLADVEGATRSWLQYHYVPYLQKQEQKWVSMLPRLQKNSAFRLERNANFQIFSQAVESAKAHPETFLGADWGEEDLQMQEAVDIVKDMIFYDKAG